MADSLPQRHFPIRTATACQLKWNWSTVFLNRDLTASCHRTNPHAFDTQTFDFHNTAIKQEDRRRMLAGEWPGRGCEYCRDIERAGGQSDRMTNLDFPGMHAPPELYHQSDAVSVTPRILEIYFDNTCDLKCLYCGPWFSSLWDAENKRHGEFRKNDLVIQADFKKSQHIEQNKHSMFAWLREHGHDLTQFNVLGGEPLYQPELDQVLEHFQQHPAPNLKLQIFSNLNARLPRLQGVVDRVNHLIDQGHIREFEVTASLDCWGAPQEYVRYPLSLARWQDNFEYLLAQPRINLIIGSTVTPLTVKTLPDLLLKFLAWRRVRPIYHYQNSVNSPSYMFIDIFGDIFQEDFQRALDFKPTSTPEEQSSRQYLAGIARQSADRGPNVPEIQKLHDFLTEMDRRRSTSWRQTFPWLISEFAKYGVDKI